MPAGDRVTAPGHIQFGELLLGPGTPYRWRELPGWEDSPALDSGTTPRPSAHGAYPGDLWAQPRTITVDKLTIRAPGGRIGAAMRELKAGTALSEDEQPLVVMLDERGPLLVWARCLRQAIPIGKGYRTGTVAGCALQFEASDPRRYSLDEQSAETALPRDEAGLDWHVTADPATESLLSLDLGSAGSAGTLTVTNAGDAPAPAVLAFRGPVSGPSLTDTATGRTWSYDIELAAGDELLVDGATGEVTLAGASRLYTTTGAPEQLLVVPPGVSEFAFRAAPDTPIDPAARAVLRWRHAYW
ncbi:phage tail domain-containing protein [Kitasatospora phosalacinea]|uniref:Phage tail protein n=1 Tax=Kitasatospora phosalacinea TaxID=2065 RepID=A0A9W6PF58_9ACTN|nr:phage tail domain-containing protein [Kitasatospora phosalacinea]GLW53976.1 hypothetical protein Kpho01_19870 [Kitasatospora phosalacinea]